MHRVIKHYRRWLNLSCYIPGPGTRPEDKNKRFVHHHPLLSGNCLLIIVRDIRCSMWQPLSTRHFQLSIFFLSFFFFPSRRRNSKSLSIYSYIKIYNSYRFLSFKFLSRDSNFFLFVKISNCNRHNLYPSLLFDGIKDKTCLLVTNTNFESRNLVRIILYKFYINSPICAKSESSVVVSFNDQWCTDVVG